MVEQLPFFVGLLHKKEKIFVLGQAKGCRKCENPIEFHSEFQLVSTELLVKALSCKMTTFVDNMSHVMK